MAKEAETVCAEVFGFLMSDGKKDMFHMLCSVIKGYKAVEAPQQTYKHIQVKELKRQTLPKMNKAFTADSSVCTLSERNDSAMMREAKVNVEALRESAVQVLPHGSYMSSEAHKLALKKETQLDVKESSRHQAEQNLQICLKETALSTVCTCDGNINNVCSVTDVLPLKTETYRAIDETQKKTKARLQGSGVQDLTSEKSTADAGSVVNRLPSALTLPFTARYAEQQSMISMNMIILANRELLSLMFETKHLSVFGNVEHQVLHGLFHSLTGDLMNPTISEIQVCLKQILQKYNNNNHRHQEAKAITYYLLKQREKDFGKDALSEHYRNLIKDKNSSVVNLSQQEEHTETAGIVQYVLRKERRFALNQTAHKEHSVKSGGSRDVNESDEVSEVSLHEALQQDIDCMNQSARQKKYANKEVQTISTGDILYFKVVTDM